MPERMTDEVRGPKPKEKVTLCCLYCKREMQFDIDSNEANGVFNVFCRNGECEDRYAWRL